MICNARQYRITKAQAARFARAVAEFDESLTTRQPIRSKLIRAQREAVASQLESLQQELAEHERLRKTRLLEMLSDSRHRHRRTIRFRQLHFMNIPLCGKNCE